MTLLELCEPLFQFMCRVNRSARKGSHQEQNQIRSDIRGLFADLAAKALSTPGLRDQYEKVRLGLAFFVDHMIRTSSLSFAAQWHPLAEEEDPPIYTGDEMFFDLLDQTIRDRTDAANERLAVFYTCMGLGFLGFFENDPEAVHRKMKEIAGRIRSMMDPEDVARICPEAYDALNPADLTGPPLRSLTPISIALIGLIIVLFAANSYLYWSSSAMLKADVRSVLERASQPIAGSPIPTSRPSQP